MARLKEVRPHPLLELPPAARERWMGITKGDVKAMEAAFEEEVRECRGGGWHRWSNVPEMAYHLRVLGFHAEIKPEDLANILKRMEVTKGGREGMLAHITLHYHLGRLGLCQEPPDEDKRYVNERLEFDRGVAEWDLMWTHYYSRKLNIGFDITLEDRKMMTGNLELARSNGKGDEIADILFHMAELGVPQEVTGEDTAAIKEKMEDYRRRNYGFGLIRLHYHLKHLFPQTSGKETPPLPPTKDYGKLR